ncbi:nucleolar protein 9 isoform X4 [Pipistrellus kuhlii]|uniref:nucleolar protein 9 isoform X4 n=1 Tax=Pipistrellus kuhlii TaxID=59472 RepID=UPI00174F2535|nr:nucleolar protein 9 isoform X4 [Pipistrellus kuhlii]
MGLGPRSPHKAGRRFPAGGKRGRGAQGSGRPSGPQRCPPPVGRSPDGRSPPALDAHPHLSPEALGYFRRALSALKEAPEAGEERELMVHNVLKEVEAQALALATNRTGSEMLQELLGFSPLKPLCRVLAALRSNLRSVACHRCGVHVLESALLQLPRLLGSCEEEEEAEEEEEKEPPLDTLEELVLGLASEVCDDFLFYCGDTHGSFVVRTLLQVLGGTLLEAERARHRGSRSPEAQRTPTRECKPADFEVPESFLNCLRDLSSCFLKDIAVFITDKISSFCFQVALQILHRKLPQLCAHLCNAVIDYLSNRNSSADGSPLLLFLRDQTSSRLLEQVLLVLEPPRLQSLFEDHFQGQLQAMAAHPIANFPLQRLLDAVTTPELAFHCAEPSSRQVACVPLFATLMAYEVYYGLVEEEGAVPADHQVEMGTAKALGEVTVLGSLLLQHLLHFSTPGLILRSLGALTGPQFLTLAQSPAGSHVLDAILTSPSVTRKQRRRVLKILKGQYVALACSRHGSRVLDAIWNGAALGARKEIAAELGEYHQVSFQTSLSLLQMAGWLGGWGMDLNSAETSVPKGGLAMVLSSLLSPSLC